MACVQTVVTAISRSVIRQWSGNWSICSISNNAHRDLSLRSTSEDEGWGVSHILGPVCHHVCSKYVIDVIKNSSGTDYHTLFMPQLHRQITKIRFLVWWLISGAILTRGSKLNFRVRITSYFWSNTWFSSTNRLFAQYICNARSLPKKSHPKYQFLPYGRTLI